MREQWPDRPPPKETQASTLLAIGTAVLASFVAIGLGALCAWALAGPEISNILSGGTP